MFAVTQVVLSFVLLAAVNTGATYLTTDYLENGYCITSQNSLIKFDSTGNLLFTYNQNRYGKLQLADATNPLKLVLSYPDYGTVVMVDNTLSEIGVIPLRPLGILSYSTVCFSPKDNNIWVFDDQEFKLKKIDNNNNIIIQSSDMFSLTGKAIHPVFMEEKDQFIYLADPAEGIVIFDVYGTYIQTLPFRNLSKFQVRNDQLFYKDGNKLHSFQVKTLEEKEIALPDSAAVIDVRIEKNRLYLLTKEGINIYRY